jgi:glutamate-ammonia-ligase adenylyltransferase
LRLKKLSNDFINKFTGYSAGNLSEKDFEMLLNLFETEIQKHFFTVTSESNLLRIINSMFDKFFFLSECLKYPHYLEILLTIASNSNYLSDILVINPEYFYLIVNPSNLDFTIDKKNYLIETKEVLNRFNSIDSKVQALNSLKRREILRIGLKDIYLKRSIDEITSELSVLAKILTSTLFSDCYHYILNKYKIEKINRSYCILALGKLGGNELNYSSDVDLIVFYDNELKIGNRYYSEILSETIQLFINKCSSSESGNLYRIDLRLRPDGKSSSACRSLQEYLDYYESRGSDWERQMLIKVSFLGGSEKLYNQFIKYIDRFIYPTTHFVSPLEQMKKLKQIIEREAEDTDSSGLRPAGTSNIKLIPGGIRDIEFIVQALQLLNGGKYKSLKTGNTLDALIKLNLAGFLTKDEEHILREAYILYRKVEHFLQLMNNSQTHTIPDKGETAEKLSFYLGFKDLKEFQKKIKELRAKVRAIYNSIVGEEKIISPEDKNFQQINFKNPQRAFSDIKFLRVGKGLTVSRKFDKKSFEAFRQIEPNIIEYLLASAEPDLCLSNFVRIIKQADFPSIWYNEFTDKNFLNIFLNLCENSQFVIDLFAEDKILRESFLSRDFLSEINKNDLYKLGLKNLLFRFGVQLILGLAEYESVSKSLSETIIYKIKSLVEEQIIGKKWSNDYLIIVLGSTGMHTMSFGSDIDLIFVVNNSGNYETIQKEFQEILGILKKELAPFSVDCRLRPEGKSSQLVWDFEKYIAYLISRAKIWEFQSLLKARFVCGNKKLFHNLNKSFLARTKKLSEDEIKKEIIAMRSKSLSTFSTEMNLIDLKKNSGGLSDVEYAAHFILLSREKQLANFIGKSIPEIITSFKGKTKVLNELADNYIFLKKLEVFNQLVFSTSSSKLAEDDFKYNKLSRFLGFKDGIALKSKLNSVFKTNREYFSKLIFNK